MKPMFSSGDKVFAKVRGYPPWPARVEGSADETPNKMRYHIYFYGTGETAVVKGEDIWPFVQFKTKFGKPKKQKNFAEALLQIESELTPEEQRTLAELEENYIDPKSFRISQGDDARRSSGAGKPKTSISPSPRGKDKRKRNGSDSGAEDDPKKRTSVLSNCDSEPKSAEVMSRSGRKIKPKRFADFEDENNEDSSTNQSPIVRPVSKVGPVKKVDKEESSEQKYLLAYVNNEKIKIPLGLNQPNFASSKRLEEWKYKELSYAKALKKRLEAGEKSLMSVEDHMLGWSKDELIQSRKACQDPLKNEMLKTETEILELDLNIRMSLNTKDPDLKKCMEYLERLAELKFTPLILKKHHEIVSTIRKVRRFVGTGSTPVDDEHLQLASEIRDKADHIYNIFQSLFFIPDNKTFVLVYEAEREQFEKRTRHMTGEEISRLMHDFN